MQTKVTSSIHPILSDVCTMGRMINIAYCINCHGGDVDDCINTDILDDNKYSMTVVHTSHGCSIQECIDQVFDVKYSEASFSTSTYEHVCGSEHGIPTPVERLRLMSLKGDHEKVLILHLLPKRLASKSERISSQGQLQVHELVDMNDDGIAIPQLTIDLTQHFEDFPPYTDVNDANKIEGHLTGYIARIEGAYRSVKHSEGHEDSISSGHFISVTKYRDTGDFFLSDDQHPYHKPENIGKEPTGQWPVPLVMFYTVKAKCLKPWAEIVIPTKKKRKVSMKSDSKKPPKKKIKDSTKNGGTLSTFTLPFFPILTDDDIEEADQVRNVIDATLPEGKNMNDAYVIIPGHQKYFGGPIFKLINNGGGQLDLKSQLLETYYKKEGLSLHKSRVGHKGSLPVTFNSISGLANKIFVNDEVLSVFVTMFNKRESTRYLESLRRNKKNSDRHVYAPAHMFASTFLERLCFDYYKGTNMRSEHIPAYNKGNNHGQRTL